METASKDAHELAQGRGQNPRVNKLSSKMKSRPEKTKKSKTHKDCFRCGMNNHPPEKCYFRERECYVCKKIGHSKKVCTAKVHRLRDQVDSDSESDEATIYHIGDDSNDAIFITLEIEQKKVKMELDTGASVSVIGLHDYRKYFPRVPLRSTKLKLQMYNQSVSHPEGMILVNVNHKGETHELPLYVIKHGDHPLLGRNWLKSIKPDWPKIKSLKMAQGGKDVAVKELKEKFEDVFSPGKMQDIGHT